MFRVRGFLCAFASLCNLCGVLREFCDRLWAVSGLLVFAVVGDWLQAKVKNVNLLKSSEAAGQQEQQLSLFHLSKLPELRDV